MGVRPWAHRAVPALWTPCPVAGCGCCVPRVSLHVQLGAHRGSRCPPGQGVPWLWPHLAQGTSPSRPSRWMRSPVGVQGAAECRAGEKKGPQRAAGEETPLPSLPLLFVSSAAASPRLRGASTERQSCGRPGAPAAGAAAAPAGPRVLCCRDLLFSVELEPLSWRGSGRRAHLRCRGIRRAERHGQGRHACPAAPGLRPGRGSSRCPAGAPGILLRVAQGRRRLSVTPQSRWGRAGAPGTQLPPAGVRVPAPWLSLPLCLPCLLLGRLQSQLCQRDRHPVPGSCPRMARQRVVSPRSPSGVGTDRAAPGVAVLRCWRGWCCFSCRLCCRSCPGIFLASPAPRCSSAPPHLAEGWLPYRGSFLWPGGARLALPALPNVLLM